MCKTAAAAHIPECGGSFEADCNEISVSNDPDLAPSLPAQGPGNTLFVVLALGFIAATGFYFNRRRLAKPHGMKPTYERLPTQDPENFRNGSPELASDWGENEWGEWADGDSSSDRSRDEDPPRKPRAVIMADDSSGSENEWQNF
jgi:hypothetical protein